MTLPNWLFGREAETRVLGASVQNILINQRVMSPQRVIARHFQLSYAINNRSHNRPTTVRPGAPSMVRPVLALGIAAAALFSVAGPAAAQTAADKRAVLTHYAEIAQRMYTDSLVAARALDTAIGRL